MLVNGCGPSDGLCGSEMVFSSTYRQLLAGFGVECVVTESVSAGNSCVKRWLRWLNWKHRSVSSPVSLWRAPLDSDHALDCDRNFALLPSRLIGVFMVRIYYKIEAPSVSRFLPIPQVAKLTSALDAANNERVCIAQMITVVQM